MPTSVPLLPVAGWLCLVLAVGAGARPLRGPASPRVPWGAWLLLGAALLCFRWPLISLPHELHPDESQLLAGAITLRHDPLFWRSVDGGTAGPLDYYALSPAAFFGNASAYAVARIIAAGLIWGAVVAAGETIVLLTGRPVARLAALPALLFAAFTTSPEFVHYSTELVPALLLALAVLALARREIGPTRANLWSAALLLGAVPWAKLQAAPLAAGLGLWVIVREWRAGRRGEAALLVAAAGLPTLAVLLALALTGETENMVVPYVLQNLLYTQSGRIPLASVVLQQGQQALTNGYLALWIAGSVVFFAGVAATLRHASAQMRGRVLAAAGVVLAAAACAVAPGRPYGHYLHFLAMPLTLLLGALLAAAGNVRRTLVFFALCLVVPLAALRISPRPDPFAYYNTVLTAPTAEHRELVARVRAFTRPGETLGLWGWRSSLYVETGLPQATCQAHTESPLIAGPSQAYYLRRYLEKLTQAAPPVFVDAVGPGNFRFHDRRFGHEAFPWLRQWVNDHYTYLGEWDGCRAYVRRDLLAAPPSS